MKNPLDKFKFGVCVAFFAIFLAIYTSKDKSVQDNRVASWVETLEAVQFKSSNGIKISVNGRIRPIEGIQSYYFEYGNRPKYGFETREQVLYPFLGAYIKENFDANSAFIDSKLKMEHVVEQNNKNNGFIRLYQLPKQERPLDDNHAPTMGIIQLAAYLYIGPYDNNNLKTLALGGGNADLRNGRLHISLRGKDIKRGDFNLYLWLQSQRNIEFGILGEGWRRANWVLKQKPLTPYLWDGLWHDIDLQLINNSSHWTYAGNNPKQFRFAARYAYWSLNKSLENANVDILFNLSDVKDDSKGSIDMDNLIIEYHNKSLIFPSNGGRLIHYPPSEDNPSTLTDGWRFGDGKMWKSERNPDQRLEFIYVLPRNSFINTVQIHQNPDWPAKDISVEISQNGKSYVPVLTGQMPQSETGKENYAYLLKRNINKEAVYFKVIVSSGYKSEYWRLGEIEVFGKSVINQVDLDKDYYVNQGILTDVPGEKIYYRLVVKTPKGKFYGRQREFIIQ